ncbi:DUF2147 domain-containing protein [Bradyrhizobium tropiciagri]|uniref:DUF2147 domain-containing protein n=1 Tax=Bradyrhizobium tropiciagri TaxID=312253 RepID=UPI001BAA9826|nr:DUF2147 domain-containing protein [Bradyrhizobium tropiciagri]MBR0899775.1 DUF2147 domain-containing protein [Bradyrhizobium tropiciagri]
MKRCCLLVALLLFTSLAHAGEGISFSIGGHRVHLDSARCRTLSCVSVTGTSRRDDGTGSGRAMKPLPAPATTAAIPAATPAIAPPAPVAPTPPPIIAAAPSPTAVPTPSAPPPRVMTPPPAPVVAAPPPSPAPSAVVPARPRPLTQVSREPDEADDGPIGDWQTETSSLVRVRLCGNALCGYALDRTTRDLGEAVLINMKPNTDARWSGNVYSEDSGRIRYGTIELKGADSMRVEACAIGRFYCSGVDWVRISHSRARVTQGQRRDGPRS